MQSEALSIAPPIDVASPIAATAITLPITARIKAYSAADAPDSSFHRFFKKLFMTSSRILGGPHPGMQRCFQASGNYDRERRRTPGKRPPPIFWLHLTSNIGKDRKSNSMNSSH